MRITLLSGFAARLIASNLVLSFGLRASPPECQGAKNFETYARNAGERMRVAPWPEFSSTLQQDRPVVAAQTCNGASVTEGMVHHFSGEIFLKDQSLPKVIDLLKDYANRRLYFAGDILDSAVDCMDGQEFKVYMKLNRSFAVVDAVFDTVNWVSWDIHKDSASSQSRSLWICSTGRNDSRLAGPPCRTSDYLLGLDSFWRYKESNRGVYIQGETIALSKALGSLKRSVADSINKASLERTLTNIRNGLIAGTVPRHPTGKTCTL